jgi:hypothetical protein
VVAPTARPESASGDLRFFSLQMARVRDVEKACQLLRCKGVMRDQSSRRVCTLAVATLNPRRNARAGRQPSAGPLLEHPARVRAHAAEAMSDELPFKMVRSNGTDEVLARVVSERLLIILHRRGGPSVRLRGAL